MYKNIFIYRYYRKFMKKKLHVVIRKETRVNKLFTKYNTFWEIIFDQKKLFAIVPQRFLIYVIDYHKREKQI